MDEKKIKIQTRISRMKNHNNSLQHLAEEKYSMFILKMNLILRNSCSIFQYSETHS